VKSPRTATKTQHSQKKKKAETVFENKQKKNNERMGMTA